VLRIAGRTGAAGPIAETMIARWVLAQAGRRRPDGPLTLAIDGWCAADGRLTGTVRRTAARAAGLTLVIHDAADGALFRMVPVEAMAPVEAGNLAGEPLYALTGRIEEIVRDAAPFSSGDARRARDLLSLGRAALIVGALEHSMQLSLEYAAERVQFGRPIAKFQAVQQLLAILAGAVAAASAITFAAARAFDTPSGSALVDAARIRLGDSIDSATAIAHQVHGAIGITHEYPLHRFTRRLWAWRDEAARTPVVRERFAAQFADCGPEEFWPFIVDLCAAAHSPT